MELLHIGLGESARDWLGVVRSHRHITSVGGVDADAAARDQARNVGVASYESLEVALKEVTADAALVASPVESRAADVIAALEMGLAVLVEPPLAPGVAAATQVMVAAQRAGRPVVVAQTHRYGRCERAMRTLIREGKVGTVTHVSCIDRRTQALDGVAGGEMWQLREVAASHFDSLRGVLDTNPVRGMAQISNAPWGLELEGTTTEAFWEMEQKIPVQYYGSLTSNRDEFELRVEGEYGALRADRRRVWWRKRGARFFLPIRIPKVRAGDTVKGTHPGAGALLNQLVAAVTEGRQPETHGEDNLWSLAMVEAAMQSSRTGRMIEIADVFASANAGGASGVSQNQDTRS